MKYAYFPGCSAESTARDMHQSTLAVAEALGLELIEPKGWTCCGATAGHQTDRILAAALPAATLVKVKDMGLDMVVNCAACYNRMKVANHEIATNKQVRAKVAEAVGRDYDGSVKVRHLLEVLLDDVGTDAIEAALHKSLAGHEGGQLLRLSAGPAQRSDRLRRSGESELAGSARGRDGRHGPGMAAQGRMLRRGPFHVADRRGREPYRFHRRDGQAGRRRVHRGQLPHVPDQPRHAAARHRQEKGNRYEMPVLYITQLLGLCLGIAPEKLGLNKLMISPAKVVKAVVAA